MTRRLEEECGGDSRKNFREQRNKRLWLATGSDFFQLFRFIPCALLKNVFGCLRAALDACYSVDNIMLERGTP